MRTNNRTRRQAPRPGRPTKEDQFTVRFGKSYLVKDDLTIQTQYPHPDAPDRLTAIGETLIQNDCRTPSEVLNILLSVREHAMGNPNALEEFLDCLEAACQQEFGKNVRDVYCPKGAWTTVVDWDAGMTFPIERIEIGEDYKPNLRAAPRQARSRRTGNETPSELER